MSVHAAERMNLRPWLNHAALNLGVALAAVFWACPPPHWHHSEEECRDLSRGRARDWLRWGMDVGPKP